MTPHRWRTGLSRVNAVMLAVAIVVVAVWAMDHLGSRTVRPGIGTVGQAEPSHEGRPRVFLFLIDSLRYQTATDRSRMPYLCSMEGVRAEVLSSRDAVTVSAIREMFTGRQRFLAFGFVKDFLTGRESVESIFTQLRQRSVPVSVYPPYAFEQFADDLPQREVDPTVADRDQKQQDAWMREGLRSFTRGEVDFAVAHIVYSDRVGHDVGVDGAAYRTVFRHVDDLVREIDQAVAPQDTVVIAGDHGHTDDGRHSLGLDVPTFALYRGPGFAPGIHLGTVPIAAHRYLSSWAMQLPLSSGYHASRYPAALRSKAELPASYVAAQKRTGPARTSHAPYLLVALALGLIAGLWLGIVWGWWRVPRLATGAAWGALGALALIGLSEIAAAACLAICGWALWHHRRRGGARRPILVALSAGGAGLLLHGWGILLAQGREVVHEPSWVIVQGIAALLVVLAGGLAWRIGAPRAAWWVVGGVGVLAYPTVYRYGAMPALVTLWMAWLAALLVGGAGPLARDGRSRAALHERVHVFALVAAILLLIQPFAFADAGNFQMHSWRPWVEAVMPHGHEEWVDATLIVKLILLARWRVPNALKPLGVWAAFEIHHVQWGMWHPSSAQYLGMIVVLAAAGFVAKRALSEASGREVRRVCWLWALYLAYYYTIQIPNDHTMWADCFLAALWLSSRLAARVGSGQARAHHRAILMMFAIVVAGWVTVAWTLHLYEWKFLYQLWSPTFVEDHALWFVPLINGRYLIPVLMARLVVAEGFGPATPYPRRLVWTGAGVKAISLALVLTGIGYTMADSDVYLEAVQEAAALSVFLVGLL
ncbi:MAG: alkaline phosphatase family protein [Deltaproteobacteria bacterium]|jgi:hypothetical protein|nr:alkaline phosphatase family protein [Deltaproteobacteria bacterium]MBW2530057.1 alkaline phosphatase family protein [Deltaproteobacteria bacterium]